jgi:hypothetical protein
MGPEDKLKRLEALEDETIGVLTLPSGECVRYRHGSLHDCGDMYDAFVACIGRREHWLLPYIRQIDTNEGMPGLVRALEASREQLVEGGAAEG